MAADPKPRDYRRARHATRQIDKWVRERDAAMAAMRARGATLREIAEATGMTHTGVRKILRRQETEIPDG